MELRYTCATDPGSLTQSAMKILLLSDLHLSVFPMEIDRVADKWPERKKRTRRWFAPQDAARLVNEPDLSELITSFGVNSRKSAA